MASISTKRECLTAAVEIVKAYATGGNVPPGNLPIALKEVYNQLVNLLKDANE